MPVPGPRAGPNWQRTPVVPHPPRGLACALIADSAEQVGAQFAPRRVKSVALQGGKQHFLNSIFRIPWITQERPCINRLRYFCGFSTLRFLDKYWQIVARSQTRKSMPVSTLFQTTAASTRLRHNIANRLYGGFPVNWRQTRIFSAPIQIPRNIGPVRAAHALSCWSHNQSHMPRSQDEISVSRGRLC